MEAPKVSVIVALGYICQRADDVHDELGNDTGEFGRITSGDEFDHMSPLSELDDDTELIIVDRAWPYRWDRVCIALRGMLNRVRYVPPKPSELLSRGFRVASSMRNSGAICATGEIFVFVDDFCRILADSIREIKKLYVKSNILVHPSIFPGDERTEMFSGHSPGVYICTRKQFELLRGFDENFDGAYGEEDTEFEERLDALLRSNKKPPHPRRARVAGVLFPMTKHHNGMFMANGTLTTYPGNIWPLWEFPSDFHIDNWKNHIRCNTALYRYVYEPEIKNGNRIAGNIAIGPDHPAIDILRKSKCSASCERCNASDREQQIMSYSMVHPDQRVVARMSNALSSLVGKYGKINPWNAIR